MGRSGNWREYPAASWVTSSLACGTRIHDCGRDLHGYGCQAAIWYSCVRPLRTCHIDEGFDFLGFRIQRRRKRGADKRVVYTYPSKKALASIVGRVRMLTRRSSHPTLAVLLRQLNPVLRGWCAYFR